LFYGISKVNDPFFKPGEPSERDTEDKKDTESEKISTIELSGIALNRFGILPKDFYRLCPIELDYALEDWQRQDRDKWERFRLNIYYLLNPHLKKPLSNPTKLFSFEWDIKPEDIEFSEDYIKRIKERDKKVFKYLKDLKDGQNVKGADNKD